MESMEMGVFESSRGNALSVAVATGVLALLLSGAGQAAEVINASANDNGDQAGMTVTTSVVAIKCLSVTGASSGGISPRCFISAPGYSSYVDIGQSVGTTGPGAVTLTCSGLRRPGRTLSCSAAVDDSACNDVELLSAYKKNGGNYGETAPMFSQASVKCTSASGASSGSTARCFLDAPGYYGVMNVGQTIVTAGPGTARLNCHGNYNANSTLSCQARVEQVCP